MTTLIEQYKGTYNGSLEWIPKYTVKAMKREIEIEELLVGWAIMTEFEQKELKMLEFFKSANTMKKHLGDWIDDNKQNTIAFESMDIATWIMQELGLTYEDIF